MEADRWIDRVNTQKTHLPEQAELAALEIELRAQLKALNDAQAAQAPVRSSYESTQREGERLRARAEGLDRNLHNSTANARDLAALQTELQHVRELLERNDDLELEYLMAVEPLDEAVNAVKVAAQPAVARRAELQAAIAELQASLDDELVALRASRVERTTAIPPNCSLVTRRSSRAWAPPGRPRSSRDTVTAVASPCRHSISTDGRGSPAGPS